MKALDLLAAIGFRLPKGDHESPQDLADETLARVTNDLARRSRLTPPGHLVFLTLAWIAGGLVRAHLLAFLVSTALFLVACGARLLVCLRPAPSRAWRGSFAGITLVTAVLWGGLAAFVGVTQGITAPTLILWFVVAATAAGATSSLAPQPTLAQIYIAVTQLPMALTAGLQPRGGLALSLIVLAYAAFLIMQVREAGRVYWATLADQRALATRAHELEEARKLAEGASRTRKALLAATSEELRTPLNGVLGLAELLSDTTLSEEQHRLVTELKGAGDDLRAAISQILDYSRLAGGRVDLVRESVDLVAMLDDELAAYLVRTNRAGVRLAGVVEPALPAGIAADRVRLGQVVRSLLDYVSATSGRGALTVRASAQATTQGDRIRFSVHGKAAAATGGQLAWLSLPFGPHLPAASSSARARVDLGLVISKLLVESWGGTIGSDTDGDGSTTTLWFTLPLQKADVITYHPLHTKSVAVVGPDEDTCEAARGRVRALGAAAVETYPDLARATEATRSGTKFDLVLVDASALSVIGGETLLEGLTGLQGKAFLMTPNEAAERPFGPAVAASLQLPVSRAKLGATWTALAGDADLTAAASTRNKVPINEVRGHVLVADDNATTQLVLRAFLKKLGFKVTLVGTGTAAVAAAAEMEADAIFMDWQMPGMDGLVATGLLRAAEKEKGQRRPILGITSGDEHQAARCLEAGMDEVLPKPISLDALDKCLRKWVKPSPLLAPATESVNLDQPAPEAPGAVNEAKPARKTRLLIADGDPSSLLALTNHLGATYDLSTVSDGRDAIRSATEGGFDMVLIDAQVPGTDGIEATQLIKQRTKAQHLPVLVMIRAGDEEALTGALSVGADGVLAKPIKRQVLDAEIAAALRTRDLFREVRHQRDQLGGFQERANKDFAIAETIFKNILGRASMGLASLQVQLSPLERFNGDVVMVAPAGTGKLRFLVGDFTGHGLGAAVGALPIADVFYGTARRQLPLEITLREMNRKVRDALPRGMFLCALIGELDTAHGRVTYWNGGLPVGYVMRADGSVRLNLVSRQVPLGVLGATDFNDQLDSCDISREERLFFCTDGVVEAPDPVGVPFGVGRLKQALATNDGEPFSSPEVRRALQAHRGHAVRGDDVTFFEIRNDDRLRAELATQSNRPSEGTRRIESLERHFGPEDVRAQDPLEELRAFIEERITGARDAAVATSVVSELFVNAIDHGLLKLDSRLKDGIDGLTRYFAQRTERLGDLRDGAISVRLEMRDTGLGQTLRIRVEDSGAGFHPPAATPATPEEDGTRHKYGRGLTLVRKFCRRVEWLDAGRVADAELPIVRKADS